MKCFDLIAWLLASCLLLRGSGKEAEKCNLYDKNYKLFQIRLFKI
jgi:hypothetical protein